MIMVGSDQVSVIPRRLNVESYGEIPVFGVINGTTSTVIPVLKRICDPIVALIALVMLLPFLLVTALLIKLDSSGPVLFTHTRIGRNGRPFTFYKFRSMVVGSDRDVERQEKLRLFIGEGKPDKSNTTKIVDDQKVTRIGRFIRKTSVDELPQLLNVVKGDMSLVGPRPCLPYEWENYAAWHKRRLSVTPGCTGVWQVLGRSEVGFRDMVILDLFYAYNISFHLDFWLVLKTIPVMLFGTGGK
jgi:lipopolysaccharide/colanic/teichoic acid biosynthesis glycosyltransferase